MGSISNGMPTDASAFYFPSQCSPIKESQLFSRDTLEYHLDLLNSEGHNQDTEETCLAPILSSRAVRRGGEAIEQEEHPKISQIGLLAGISHMLNFPGQVLENKSLTEDPRLLLNVSSPSSTFICGSQGSGKSHTLSCMLENCLIKSEVGRLPHPLTGAVFHYDAFISDTSGSPCEAAFLSSHPGVNVRVLCSPTNIRTIRVRKPLIMTTVYSNFRRLREPIHASIFE